MRVCAIDPGKAGGVVIVQPNPPLLVEVLDLPLTDGEWDPVKVALICRCLSQYGVQRVIIEKVHAMPTSFRGGLGQFELALIYGMWMAGLASVAFESGIVVRPVHAATWKKVMGVLSPAPRQASAEEKQEAYKRRKLLAVERAEQLFRRSFRTPRGRLMDGEAEACLLALYEDTLLGERS